MSYPGDRRYTKEHEWVRLDGPVGTVGITQFAQDQLGDIVYVEVPELGRRYEAGEVLGTIESVKAVSEIYAPVSGTVTEVNAELDRRPELVNAEPHAGGWYCKLELSRAAEYDALMDAETYASLASAP